MPPLDICKGLVFCRNNGWIMENLNKEPIVQKWVLINRRKILQTFSAQFVCPSPKVWNFDDKRPHWASVIRTVLGQGLPEANCLSPINFSFIIKKQMEPIPFCFNEEVVNLFGLNIELNSRLKCKRTSYPLENLDEIFLPFFYLLQLTKYQGKNLSTYFWWIIL